MLLDGIGSQLLWKRASHHFCEFGGVEFTSYKSKRTTWNMWRIDFIIGFPCMENVI